MPLVVPVVSHRSLVLEEESGFEIEYGDPASSHTVAGLDCSGWAPLVPNETPVTVGGFGEPPVMLYVIPSEYWWM